MKKISFLICLSILFILTGCNKDESVKIDKADEGTIKTLVATSNVQAETKVSMDYHTGAQNYIEIKWKENDKIAMYPVASNGTIDYANPVLFTLKSGAAQTSGVFEADGDGALQAGTKYLPVHTGSSEISNVSNYSGVFKFSIPDIQTQSTAGNIDHIADNQFFTADAFEVVSGVEPTVAFKHNLAAIKFNIKGGSGTLQSVSLTAPGSYFLSGATLSADDYKSLMVTRSYKVNLSAPSPLSATPSEIWMLSWWNPQVTKETGWIEDGKYSVIVSTSEGVYTLNNALPATKIFEAGNIYSVDIDLSIATKVNFSDPNGTFVLNEGNMTSDNGSLIYITAGGTAIDFVYRLVNSSYLGNATQDLFIANNKMYIIAQNGERDGGDGTLVVADAATLKKVAAYKGAPNKGELLSALNWPSHVAAVGDVAYIRDNAGIYKFDMLSQSLSFIEGTKGAKKLRMAVAKEKVFVPTNSNVLVLQNGAVVETLSFGTVTAVLKADDNHIWVADSKNKKIIKVNATDYSQVENAITEGGLSMGWGASPSMTAKGNSLYFNNNGFTFYKHDFDDAGSGITSVLGDTKALFPTITAMAYNMPAIHPVTGQIFFNTIAGYGWSFLTNDISVWNTDPDFTLAADYKDYTRFPAGVYFPANF